MVGLSRGGRLEQARHHPTDRTGRAPGWFYSPNPGEIYFVSELFTFFKALSVRLLYASFCLDRREYIRRISTERNKEMNHILVKGIRFIGKRAETVRYVCCSNYFRFLLLIVLSARYPAQFFTTLFLFTACIVVSCTLFPIQGQNMAGICRTVHIRTSSAFGSGNCIDYAFKVMRFGGGNRHLNV